MMRLFLMPTVTIPLQKAKPGMVLAEDIYTVNGKMILCKKGTELTEDIIRRIENIGIESIVIEEHMNEEKRKRLLQEKLELIEKAFSTKSGDCLNMIKDALKSFWNKKLSENE